MDGYVLDVWNGEVYKVDTNHKYNIVHALMHTHRCSLFPTATMKCKQCDSATGLKVKFNEGIKIK